MGFTLTHKHTPGLVREIAAARCLLRLTYPRTGEGALATCGHSCDG